MLRGLYGAIVIVTLAAILIGLSSGGGAAAYLLVGGFGLLCLAWIYLFFARSRR
jgi:hypothetical protein